MKTANKLFLELCEEIDHYKSEAEYWEQKYRDLLSEYTEYTQNHFEQTQKDVGNALMFALSASEGPNGELLIDKEARKQLAENWKE